MNLGFLQENVLVKIYLEINILPHTFQKIGRRSRDMKEKQRQRIKPEGLSSEY